MDLGCVWLLACSALGRSAGVLLLYALVALPWLLCKFTVACFSWVTREVPFFPIKRCWELRGTAAW